ncbi:MAG TPA: two-component regulator propeller domain-containing protein, partial [Puia sp.]
MAYLKKRSNFCCLPFTLIMCALMLIYLNPLAQNKNPVQTKRCPINTINYRQGLMNNSIVGIITDAQGFTWVSTSTGLQRYNGYTLQTITPVADGDTILINYPVYFLEGKNNSILIGYRNGVLEYNAEKNSFRKIISAASDGKSMYALMPIKQTDENTWCFEETKGIVVYDKNGIASAQFNESQTANIEDMLRTEGYNISRKLIAANDHYIFLRLSLNKILQIDINTHQTKTIDYPGAGIYGIECDKKKVFVASGDGLSYINISNGVIGKKFLFGFINDFRPITRTCIELTADDRLLVSVEKRLFEFDTACICQKEIISLNHQPLLNAGYIQIAYEDKFRRIWLLTHEDIKRIQNAETPFAQFIYNKEKDNFIRCIYYDKQKNIVLGGAWYGAIQLFDSSGNPMLDAPIKSERIKQILAIEKLSDDHYLIITQGNGLHMLHLQTKQIYPVDVNNNYFQSAITQNSYSNNLQRVDDSTIFLCTKENVFSCHIQKDKISNEKSLLEEDQINGSTISCFIYSSKKTLWVSTLSGIILKLDEHGSFKKINIPENYVVRCMAEDGVHNIWVGTERGLFIYDAEGKLITYFSRESGLLNDFIYALLPADKSNNNFFASTNFGLSFISKDGKIKNYTRELGLQENEFNTGSSAMSPSGKLFFGGINGITAFYPSELSAVSDSSLINITRLVVNDSLYNLFGGAWSGDSIRLAHNQNHIQFDIAATGLLDPTEYLYRYRLNSFEKSWQTTSQATGIRYTLE